MSTTSSTGSSSTALQLSGLASGIDWQSLITQLVAAERTPETAMQAQQTTLGQKNSAYQSIGTKLTTLNTDISTITATNFFDSRTTSVSAPAVASATASDGTAAGSYTFNISQLATAAAMQGATVAATPLSATNDVSGLVLTNAGFANPVTAGTFSVNGKTVTIAAGDTLQTVFNNISTATGGAVTASYNSATDEITLAGSGPIVLGSATDTSNFLQDAKLFNNGSPTITSTSALGGIKLVSNLSAANLATPISDGGSGNGAFMINGVTIDFNASTDSITNVLARINNSGAGVTATFDSVNNRFLLTNKTTGDMGISLQDVTGNFLAASGLSAGTLQRGNNLQYTINGGGTLTSQSNLITSDSSGLTGLSVTALGTGPTTITVGTDTAKISTAITNFVNDYNAVQNYITSQTASTTDSSGNFQAGLLTGDLDVEDLSDKLRQTLTAAPTGLTGAIKTLNDMGIISNGNDNTLSVSNTTALNNALATNLDAVKNLFTNATNGLATTLGTFLTNTTSDTGLLSTKEANFTKQTKDITASIAAMELKISDDQKRMTAEFVAMETAVSSINSQKQFLNSTFNSGSSSSNGNSTAPGL
jgi:flagellar hook-associated protein 2